MAGQLGEVIPCHLALIRRGLFQVSLAEIMWCPRLRLLDGFSTLLPAAGT